MKYRSAYDLVEPNGKTWRQNKMAIGHNIPIGTLVEVKYDRWHDGGACEKVHARMWVTGHGRDCDGTPLYELAPTPREKWGWATSGLPTFVWRKMVGVQFGFAEKYLTPVEVTPELVDGHGALKWDESER